MSLNWNICATVDGCYFFTRQPPFSITSVYLSSKPTRPFSGTSKSHFTELQSISFLEEKLWLRFKNEFIHIFRFRTLIGRIYSTKNIVANQWFSTSCSLKSTKYYLRSDTSSFSCQSTENSSKLKMFLRGRL